ncbi:MAG: hypothetical protein M1820_005638 [Bogoriella megaspora]|nr:MAG: hypothetical protein M1820_005638 [Bogoriella megaspora]
MAHKNVSILTAEELAKIPKMNYIDDVPDVPDDMHKLLEEYSHIPASQVPSHIRTVRDKAWNEGYPYGCLGLYTFLDIRLVRLPIYSEILDRLRQGQKLIDMGCCFGQELRQLVHSGVDSSQLYGTDLRQDFMDMGYELFLDRETLKSKFIASNMLDESATSLNELDGQIDIIHASLFFHLFTWDQQVVILKRCVKLLKPQPGSLIVGGMAGDIEPQERWNRQGTGKHFRHNEESWAKLWKEVGEATGTKWEVWGVLRDLTDEIRARLANRTVEGGIQRPDYARGFGFTVRRIA